MAKLTSAQRTALPASAFVFPDRREYPIHDIEHARDALSRSSGKPEEAAVRAAVSKKYPQISQQASNARVARKKVKTSGK